MGQKQGKEEQELRYVLKQILNDAHQLRRLVVKKSSEEAFVSGVLYYAAISVYSCFNYEESGG